MLPGLLSFAMWTVYVLWSESGRRFYIGLSEDPEQRLRQHNAGASRWTSRFAGSWSLVWSRTCPTLAAARTLELQLKRQKAGLGFFHLTGLNPSRFPRSPGS